MEEHVPILDYFAATTALVHTGRAILYSVQVAGAGADGDCQIYDGMNTSGDQLLDLRVLSKTSHQWRAKIGIQIKRGIYLVANATTTRVSIEYDPIE